MDVRKEVLDAEMRIRDYIRETPIEYSPFLSKKGKGKVFLKLENFQITSSFKLRGALNKLLFFKEQGIKEGFITASTGNHGAAFAYSLEKLGMFGSIYLPKTISSAKLEALRDYNVELKYYGTDCIDTEDYAKKVAVKENKHYISPYNDPQIIGGQGTIGIELERQLDVLDSVFVPIGGGGLISGVGGYLKSINPDIEIVGCQPINSPVMYESLRKGRVIDMESKSTLSDGTAGGIEKDSVTFDICKQSVDNFELVSEEEIKRAIRLIFEKHFMTVEGAAALSVASFIKREEQYSEQNVVLIVSGAKISLDVMKKVFCK